MSSVTDRFYALATVSLFAVGVGQKPLPQKGLAREPSVCAYGQKRVKLGVERTYRFLVGKIIKNLFIKKNLFFCEIA